MLFMTISPPRDMGIDGSLLDLKNICFEFTDCYFMFLLLDFLIGMLEEALN